MFAIPARNLLPFLFLTSIGIAFGSSARAEDGWKTETEAGIVITSGNTKTTTLSAKDGTTYEWSRNLLHLSANYLFQKTDGLVSAKSWSLGLRYERRVSERLGFFAGETVEGDRFKGVLQSYHSDAGAKYHFVKEDGFEWFGEGGYRYTRERSFSETNHKHIVRAYTELEKKWNASVSTKYWLELLPNVTKSEDWDLNTEASLSAVLTSIFSVKTSYLLRFDHEPNEAGLKRADQTFTTALVTKF